MNKKICILLGTRPEIIKFSPVLRSCRERKLDFFIVHTNQHYSADMDKIFFSELHLPEPKYNLNVGSSSHGDMTGKILIGLEKVLEIERPNIILVLGDTNTVLAGALAATKMGILVGHIESGLRSYDRDMPEESNRVLVDHISDFLFAPTDDAVSNLNKEGLDARKIYMTGNTIVDAVMQNKDIALKNRKPLPEADGYVYGLLTLHRPSNVDYKRSLETIIKGVGNLDKTKLDRVIFVVHPRTLKQLQKFDIQVPSNIVLKSPVGYLDMLILMINAEVILTDSGGIQEEANILKVPCVTLRENTERPETLHGGGNVLVGTDAEKMVVEVKSILDNKKIMWKNVFGSGQSAEDIINIVLSHEDKL